VFRTHDGTSRAHARIPSESVKGKSAGCAFLKRAEEKQQERGKKMKRDGENTSPEKREAIRVIQKKRADRRSLEE